MQNAYFMYPQAMQFSQPANMMMPSPQPMQNQVHDWYPAQNHSFMANAHMNAPSPFSQQHLPDPRSPMQNEQYGQHLHRTYSSPATPNGPSSHKGQKSLFNPQTRSFVPSNIEGRPANRTGRFKNQARNSLSSNFQGVGSGGSATIAAREDSLKQKYGTPPSLPKKPPPQEVRQAVDTGGGNVVPTENVQSSETNHIVVNSHGHLS